jgi:hypothetical protein
MRALLVRELAGVVHCTLEGSRHQWPYSQTCHALDWVALKYLLGEHALCAHGKECSDTGNAACKAGKGIMALLSRHLDHFDALQWLQNAWALQLEG